MPVCPTASPLPEAHRRCRCRRNGTEGHQKSPRSLSRGLGAGSGEGDFRSHPIKWNGGRWAVSLASDDSATERQVSVPSREAPVPSGESPVPSGESTVPSGESPVPSGDRWASDCRTRRAAGGQCFAEWLQIVRWTHGMSDPRSGRLASTDDLTRRQTDRLDSQRLRQVIC